jgi:hypothetical protein
VTILTGEQATRESIISAFHSAAETIGPQDVFVFYFAGHLLPLQQPYAPGELGLAPHINGGKDPTYKDAIPASVLGDLLRGVSSRNELVILNTDTPGGLDSISKTIGLNDSSLRAITGRNLQVIGFGGSTSVASSSAEFSAAILSGIGRLVAACKSTKPDALQSAITGSSLVYFGNSSLKTNSKIRLKSMIFGDAVRLAGDRAKGKQSPPINFFIDSPIYDRPKQILPGVHNYTLLVGINNYKFAPTLVNPIFDVTGLSGVLRSNYGFSGPTVAKDVNYHQLIDLLAQLQRRPQGYGANYQLLIYIASHGFISDFSNTGFIVCSDGRANESHDNCLAQSELRLAVDQIPCNHIMVVLDVCVGGSFDQGTGGVVQAVGSGFELYTAHGEHAFQPRLGEHNTYEIIKAAFRYRARLYITSGGRDFVPDGRKGHHSPFNAALLKVLRKHVLAKTMIDSELLFDEIRELVQHPLPRHGLFGRYESGCDFFLIPPNLH